MAFKISKTVFDGLGESFLEITIGARRAEYQPAHPPAMRQRRG